MPGRPTFTVFDLRSFGRCLGAGMAVAVLALVVIASTDSDHPSWWSRLARLSAMSPVFGLIGTALGLGQAKARGEWLALASIGVHPARASLGLLAGAWVLTLAGAILAAMPMTDLAALFPAVPHIDWVHDGVIWTSASGGIQLGPGREDVAWVQAVTAAQPQAPMRFWVVAAILAAGAWTPCWLLIHCGVAERVLVTFAAVAAQLWAFHAVASVQGQGWILLSGSLVLAVHGLLRTAGARGLLPIPGRRRVTQIP